MNERTVFRSEKLREEYTRITHKSGLDIYVFPKKMATAYAIFATKYGGGDSRFKLAGDSEFVDVPYGVAHFLEHKMFENENGEDTFARFGALGADINAYTAYDRTAYHFQCTENVYQSLAELLSFVTHPYFTPENVQKEQGIIAQEIQMRVDNPFTRRYFQMLQALYHDPQVYTDICGTLDSIAQITAKTLYDCYRVFYNLSNMALVVCGDVTVEEVLAVADATLPIQAPVEIIRDIPPEHRAIVSPKLSGAMDVSMPLFAIGIKDFPRNLADAERMRRHAALSILCKMLFDQSGDLYNSLYAEGLISGTLQYGYEIGPAIAYVSVCGKSEKPDTVLARVKAAVADALKNGLSHAAFLRCKRVLYADFVGSFDATADIANLMLDFLFEGVEPLSYLALLEKITFEEITQLLHEVFKPEMYAMSVVYPKEEEK